MSSRYKQEFFSIATQYYIAGRFSVFADFIPTSGNVFHHAVEMYLKGHLSCEKDKEELKKLGHRLQKIWAVFKKVIPPISTLDHFDDVILRLDKFESIRYPDEIVSRGMIASVGIGKGDSSPSLNATSRPEPRYGFDLEEIDDLVKVIFERSSVNPHFFTNSLNEDALTHLLKENQHANWFSSRATIKYVSD